MASAPVSLDTLEARALPNTGDEKNVTEIEDVR